MAEGSTSATLTAYDGYLFVTQGYNATIFVLLLSVFY